MRSGNSRVLETITRNYPETDAVSVGWKEGIFNLSDEPTEAMTSRHSNQKPTTRVSLKTFIDMVAPCIAKTGKKAVNKGRKTTIDLSKERAGNLVDMAAEYGIISTNHGKGLPRKVILFENAEADLEAEMMHRKKNKASCSTEPDNSLAKQGLS